MRQHLLSVSQWYFQVWCYRISELCELVRCAVIFCLFLRSVPSWRIFQALWVNLFCHHHHHYPDPALWFCPVSAEYFCSLKFQPFCETGPLRVGKLHKNNSSCMEASTSIFEKENRTILHTTSFIFVPFPQCAFVGSSQSQKKQKLYG